MSVTVPESITSAQCAARTRHGWAMVARRVRGQAERNRGPLLFADTAGASRYAVASPVDQFYSAASDGWDLVATAAATDSQVLLVVLDASGAPTQQASLAVAGKAPAVAARATTRGRTVWSAWSEGGAIGAGEWALNGAGPSHATLNTGASAEYPSLAHDDDRWLWCTWRQDDANGSKEIAASSRSLEPGSPWGPTKSLWVGWDPRVAVSRSYLWVSYHSFGQEAWLARVPRGTALSAKVATFRRLGGEGEAGLFARVAAHPRSETVAVTWARWASKVDATSPKADTTRSISAEVSWDDGKTWSAAGPTSALGQTHASGEVAADGGACWTWTDASQGGSTARLQGVERAFGLVGMGARPPAGAAPGVAPEAEVRQHSGRGRASQTPRETPGTDGRAGHPGRRR